MNDMQENFQYLYEKMLKKLESGEIDEIPPDFML